MMKKKIFILFFLMPTMSLFSQTIRFETEVKQDTAETNFGKNKKNNLSWGFQVGSYLNSEKTFQPYRSTVFTIGLSYNHKQAKWYSYGLNLNLDISSFVLSKTLGEKTFPDTIIHDKADISITSMGIVLYQRFNFFNKHRGKIYGNYLDIGIYGNLHLSSIYFYQDKEKTSSNNFFSKRQQHYYRGLNFLNAYDYGVEFVMGRNWLSVFFRYRLSQQMKISYIDNNNFPEMPNSIIGIRLLF